MLVYNLSPKHSRWVPSLFLRCYLRGVELQDPKGWYSQSLIEKNCLGGLEHVLFLTMSSSQLTKSIIFSIFWGNFIIPTDEVHHFSEGLGSTTNKNQPDNVRISLLSGIVSVKTNPLRSFLSALL